MSAAVGGADRSSTFVRSLERGLAVIKAFDGDHSRLTLSDVARRTGLSRASARRFLHTLVELDYVRTDDRHFELRPRVLELGYAYLSGLSLPDVARPHMQDLVSRVGESCSVSVLDGEEIVYIVRVATKRIMTVSINVGTRLPAHATSMGRVLLAGEPEAARENYLSTTHMTALTSHTVTDVDYFRQLLSEVGAQGWALVDQELEEGLRSIAVPVHGHDGTVIAAMNVSAPARRGSSEALRLELLPPLLATARAIESDLRGRPH